MCTSRATFSSLRKRLLREKLFVSLQREGGPSDTALSPLLGTTFASGVFVVAGDTGPDAQQRCGACRHQA